MLVTPIMPKFNTYNSRTISYAPSFRSEIKTTEQRFDDIKKMGYEFYKEVDVINPNHGQEKALAFVKKLNYSDYYSLDVLVANKQGYALGRVSADVRSNEYAKCVVKNFTSSDPYDISCVNWMDRDYNICRDGKYKHVGKRCYEVLEEYIRKTDKSVEGLLINALSYGSWAFHCKIFNQPECLDEYDCYDFTHYLSKKF